MSCRFIYEPDQSIELPSVRVCEVDIFLFNPHLIFFKDYSSALTDNLKNHVTQTNIWPTCKINISCLSTDPRWEPLQRTKEFCESFVPGVRVIQVTGVPRPLHHHHSVIGQIAQVWERKFPKLSVLVAVDNQSWNLVRQKIKTLLMSNFQSFSFKREAKEVLKLKKRVEIDSNQTYNNISFWKM